MPFGAEGLSHVTVIEETLRERGATTPTPEGAVHVCVQAGSIHANFR